MTWNARLKALRKKLHLSQPALAEQLGMTRVWLSMLERGEREVSEVYQIKIERMENDNSVYSQNVNQVVAELSAEDPAQFEKAPGAAELKKAIEEYMQQLLTGAGDDPVRLSWLLEELRIKVEEPVHWGMHERVMKQVLEEERVRKESAAQAQASKKSAGGAA